jgi:MFS family permease
MKHCVMPEDVLTTDIPSRLDRLPWSRWHWMVVIALGITWVLDGLEVTIVGSVAGVLESSETLGLTSRGVGFAASAYLAGAILGALVFGHLADRFGRKRLFVATLALYVVATLLTSASWGLASFVTFRFLTGTAIGGEYAAINSAIDELLPARVRGFADLAINGSYWLGTAAGAAASTVLLDPSVLPRAVGWRLAFAMGAVLALAIVLVRRLVPESPRWLLLHGRASEAESVVRGIEDGIVARGGMGSGASTSVPHATLRIIPRKRIGFFEVGRIVFGRYRRRAVLGLTLMLSQAFFYNSIFFTYALILTRFFGVAPERAGFYLLPFAAGNFLGPIVLGRLFDSIGRKPMIVTTYALSGLFLLGSGVLFLNGALTAATQTALWCATFFFASAAASSAYLTVSELFPVEIRAMAIAFFYAAGTGAGGIAAPAIFGLLIASGERREVFAGYAVGAGLMLVAAVVAAWLGVPAERRSLEEVAAPLSSVD